MKDTRLRLGFDVDGILSDFVKSYRRICEQLTGRDLSAEPVDWGMSNWGLTAEETKHAWALVTAQEDFYIFVRPYDEDAVRNLRPLEIKYRLYFITTRAVTAGMPIEMQTAYWLSQACNVNFPTVLVEENKGPLAKALRLDAMIDDKPENLWAIGKESPSTRLFLRDRSWNRDAGVDYPYTRVYSLAHFVDEIDYMTALRAAA